jgi:monofunctional biosynthetic peptidoglycan transglycosylase
MTTAQTVRTKAVPHARGRRAAPLQWLERILIVLFMLVGPAPVALLLVLRAVPVPATPQMLVSWFVGDGLHYRWVEMERISPSLARAVLASEDDRFCVHHGFDWGSIDNAVRAYEKGGRLRGASTISQQTARSLFLLPVHSWIRKGLEAWLTVLEETLWPKRRILAVYLNIVDWGHGNFGVEAAARDYFHRSASALTARQAARLAVILPDPDGWRAARPGPYVTARARVIQGRMGEVRRDGLDSCLHP